MRILDALAAAQGSQECSNCGGRGLLDFERDERGLQIGATEEFCPSCDGTGKAQGSQE